MQTRNFLAVIVGSALMLLSTTSSAWAIQENFDGQTTGADCAPFFDDGADTTVSTDRGVGGIGKSCKFATVTGRTTWGGGFGFGSKLVRYDEVWIRFRLFIPQGFDFNAYSNGNHLKFIRMTERNASGTVGRLDWYWDREGTAQPHRLILERDTCGQNCWQFFGAGDGPIRGVWETYEMYVKFDKDAVDTGGQGIVRAWKNGKLIGELTNRPTMWGDSNRISNFLIFSHWNGGSPKTQHLYFDDLVATNIAPGTSDSKGNPYIGVGSYALVAPPNPPSSVIAVN